MSGSLLFLLAAVGLSVLGVLVLWAVQHRPARFGSSIDDFRDGLKALAPEDETGDERHVPPFDARPRED